MSEEKLNVGASPDGGEFAAITSQEQLTKVIGGRIDAVRKQFADYDDLKAKAAEFDKVADAQKTEAQKVADRLAAIEGEKGALANENARLKAAVKFRLSEDDANALEGIPADRVEALAERLSKVAQSPKPPQKKAAPPGKSPDERGTPRRAAEALRALRQS